ncbi:MAG: hypothetical protein E3K36_08230 [Candidatus Brocadia sp.]|nr:hypothetical protein [Candidatus Brocadia sp.]
MQALSKSILNKVEQERIMEHLREYIADSEDENRWDILFTDTQSELSTLAEGVREEIAEGKANVRND